MPEATGQNAYIAFRSVNVSADYRELTWDESTDTVESQSGSDEYKKRLSTQKDITGTLNRVYHGADSSAVTNVLYNGAFGTLEWGPEGTASGKPKYSLACYITGASNSSPYDGVVMQNYTWSSSAGWITHFDEDGSVWGA